MPESGTMSCFSAPVLFGLSLSLVHWSARLFSFLKDESFKNEISGRSVFLTN
jgi:hypothetical protein